MKNKNSQIVSHYEKICKSSRLNILTSGRYILATPFYKKKLAKDICQKLNLSLDDSLLDLGCNIGIYHRYLSTSINFLLGVDASPIIIKQAKRKNQQAHLHYMTFDLQKPWPTLPRKFSKILIYSVIHFLDGLEHLEQLIKKANEHMTEHGTILLGEVRTKKKYEAFLNSKKNSSIFTFRNMMFKINKWFNGFYLGKPQGIPCTLYEAETIHNIGKIYGFKTKELNQQKFHPFYNTCSDFILFR